MGWFFHKFRLISVKKRANLKQCSLIINFAYNYYLLNYQTRTISLRMCQTCHVICRKFIGKNQKTSYFITVMRIVVVGMNISPLYTMNCEMNEWMPNEQDKRIAKMLFNIFVFINLWAYLSCSYTQPREVPVKQI